MTRYRLAWIVRMTILLAVMALSCPASSLHAQDSAVIHYHRPDGAYTGWGLHVQGDAAIATDWNEPLPPTGDDEFGVYWEIPLNPGAQLLEFAIHQGDVIDPGAQMTLDLNLAREAWVVTHTPQLFMQPVDPAEIVTGMAESAEPAPPPPASQPPSTPSDAVTNAPESPIAPLLTRPGVWALLSFDPAGLVILGRKYDGGAGVVVFNFSPTPQTATLDVRGFLPSGSVLIDPLGEGATNAGDLDALTIEIAPLGWRVWLVEQQ